MNLERTARDLLAIHDHFADFVAKATHGVLHNWAHEIGEADADREVQVVLKIMAERELARRA